MVSPSVTKTVAAKGSCDIFISFKAANAVADATQLDTYQRQKIAQESQKNFLADFSDYKHSMRTYWISNVIAFDGVTQNILDRLQVREDIRKIDAKISDVEDDRQGRRFSFEKREGKESDKETSSKRDETDLPPHITLMAAEKLWELGFKGQGIVVGLMATGANVNHEALKPSYRGTLPSGGFNHTYNYWEGFIIPIGEPNDGANIGTFLAGVAVGTRNIGVAPEAKFISCKMINNFGNDDPERLLKCLEWMAAPYMHVTGGVNGFPVVGMEAPADVSKRPDVVVLTECGSCLTETNVLIIDAIQVLVASGIFVVSDSGTDFGYTCNTIHRLPSILPEVFTVSGTRKSRPELINLSALGPAMMDGQMMDNYFKPDGVANGEEIVGAFFANNTSEYYPATGSTVAAAQVAGAVALLWSAVPRLRRQVQATMEILHASARPIESSKGCSSITSSPNFEFGYGYINIYNAYQIAIGSCFGKHPSWNERRLARNSFSFRR